MVGIDEFTKLMLHMNGSDGSTTFTDDSDSAHSVTANGNAQIDTAQSKFGGASGLFDGSGDYCEIPNSVDFDLGTTWTVDFWVRFNTLTTAKIFSTRTGGGDGYQIIFVSNKFGFEGFGANNTGGTQLESSTRTTGQWYHVAMVTDGGTSKFFVDGTEVISFFNSFTWGTNNPLQIGGSTDFSEYLDGWLDEVRISKGVARWTSDFTPPDSEYTRGAIANTIDITTNVPTSNIIVDTVVVPSTIDINSQILSATAGEVLTVTANTIDITSSVEPASTQSDVIVNLNTIDITSDVESPTFPVIGSLIGKIISTNPLIAVTDTIPAKIIKIDTTDPDNLVYTSATLSDIDNAKDFSFDSTGNFVYVAGSSGKVVKVEIADLSNQTTIDVSDTDDLLTIETNTNHGIVYTGTENSTGELYLLDNRNTFKLDTSFHALSKQQFLLDSNFHTVETFRMGTDFQAISENTFLMETVFHALTKPSVTPPASVNRLDVIEPIKETDYQVFIDGVELEDTDLVLNSININITIGQEQQASFRLTRKHDSLNTTLSGSTVNITGQNTVEIKCNGTTVFPFRGEETGRIAEIDARYNTDGEFVEINALAPEASFSFSNVTMSLPSVDDRLSLYNVLVQNPRIFNPFIDPNNEDNPKKFKGIRVNLGTKIEQNLIKFDEFDVWGDTANEINEGEFNPLQNWTYFWRPTIEKIDGLEAVNDTSQTIEDKLEQFDAEQRDLPINERRPSLRLNIILNSVQESFNNLFNFRGNTRKREDNLTFGTNAIEAFYVGTSLSPITEDLWELKKARHFRQRIKEDTEEDLGTYEVGEAPFQEISVRNGEKITKARLEDRNSGLFSVKDASYNFIDFAKRVADLEYEKLKNINGDVLPETSCDLNMTIDAYLYYQINLLTRINIDNTTTANIYNNNNGFPVSVKSINISSSDRRVSLSCDNKKSVKELEEINSQFPDEDDNEYNSPEESTLIYIKTDLRTKLKVE